MQKFALSFLICLVLSGCQALKRSETWSRVEQVRHASSGNGEAPEDHSSSVHSALAAHGVEHKVVTFAPITSGSSPSFRQGARSVVIYRDESDPRQPWWLAGERLERPVWLPNGTVEEQVRFYVRGRVEVLKVDEFPASGGRAEPALTRSTAPTKRRPVAISRLELRETSASDEPRRIEPATRNRSRWYRYCPVLRLFDWVRPEPRAASSSPAANAIETPDYEKLFEAKHKTRFDPGSAVDRRKMDALRQRAG